MSAQTRTAASRPDYAAGPITELELRKATRHALGALQHHEPMRLYEELRIERGASRVDFALANGVVHGFEIKSDLDSFQRMASQIHAYNRVFDRVTIITGQSLFATARKYVPKWWGIFVADREPDINVVRLTMDRIALPHDTQQAHSVATLLNREESVHLLAANEIVSVKPKTSLTALHSMIGDSIPLERLKAYTANALFSRTNEGFMP